MSGPAAHYYKGREGSLTGSDQEDAVLRLPRLLPEGCAAVPLLRIVSPDPMAQIHRELGVVVGEAGVRARRDLTKQHLTLASRGPLRDRQGAEPRQRGARDGIQDGLAWLDELLQEHLRASPQPIHPPCTVSNGIKMPTSIVLDLTFALKCVSFKSLRRRRIEQHGPLTDELQW